MAAMNKVRGIFSVFRLWALAGLVTLCIGCNQSEGSVEVDVGRLDSASRYRVHLIGYDYGLGDGGTAVLENVGSTTFSNVATGKWSVYVSALDAESNQVAYYQGLLDVVEGQTTTILADSYTPGFPNEIRETEASLESFGPNGEALLSATYTAAGNSDPESTVTLDLISGNGEAQTAADDEVLARTDGKREIVERCATCFISPEDVAEADQIRAQQVRYQVGSVLPGQTIEFFVVTTGRTITARRILNDSQTRHCLIFAEVVNGEPVLGESTALAIAQGFDSDNPFQEGDNGIYQSTRARYGSEWVQGGGRDGDERVVLLYLSSASIGGSGLFGFFNPADERSKETANSSNEAEMLYLNADRAKDDVYEALVTIAHEFSHLIIFNQKVARDGLFPEGATPENALLDEGLAVLNEELSGFGFTGASGGNFFLLSSVQKFLEEGVNRSYFLFVGGLADYGSGYMFWRFIHDQKGLGVIRQITTSPNSGRANVEAFLDEPFSPFFQRFIRAVALNGRSDLDSSLRFNNLELTGSFVSTDGEEFELRGLQGIREVVLPGSLSTSLPIKPWGTELYFVSGGDDSPLSWLASGVGTIVTGVLPLKNAR